jgi:hypothetical protein
VPGTFLLLAVSTQQTFREIPPRLSGIALIISFYCGFHSENEDIWFCTCSMESNKASGEQRFCVIWQREVCEATWLLLGT